MSLSAEQIAAIKGDQTQEEFAREIDTSLTTVNRWLRGARRPSRVFVRKLMRIARKRGVEIDG